MHTSNADAVEHDARPTGTRRVEVTRYGGPDVVTVVPADGPPEPRDGHAVVRVEATTVNSTDAAVRAGIYPLVSTTPPFVPGYDLVGTVVGLPDDHDGRLHPGQRVAALTQVGAHADHARVPLERLMPVPDDVDPVDAAPLVLAYSAAWQMLVNEAQVQAGDTVLVIGGSGAVGTALLQLARHLGVRAVATGSPGKLDHLRAQRAQAVDRTAADADARLRDAAGDGFAAIFDPIGPSSVRRRFPLLRPDGRLIAYGLHGAAQRIERRTAVTMGRYLLTFVSLLATLAFLRALPGRRDARFYNIIAERDDRPARLAGDLQRLTRLLADGDIAPRSTVLDLGAARRAHELLASGTAVGTIVLRTGA